MTQKEKIAHVVSPRQYFSSDIRLSNLFGNKTSIQSLVSYIELLRESEFWPKELHEHIRLERLKEILTYISQHSPFWADYLKKNGLNSTSITSLRELELLPILRRKALVEFGKKINVLNVKDRQYVNSRKTSGTGGLPMELMFDEKELIIPAITYRFRYPVFNSVSLHDLFKRKFVIMLGTPGCRHEIPDFVHYMFKDLSAVSLDDVTVRYEVYKKIKEAQPAMLIGFASLVLKFAQYVLEDKVTLPLIAVKVTSDQITVDDRIFIRKALQVPVVNLLSSNGASQICFECQDNMGKFHLNSERIILEIIDEDGIPLENGEEGEMVVTALDLTVTPVIRFAIGDVGKIIDEKCICGRTLPLFEFNGRRNSEFVLPSGKKVRSVHIQSHLLRTGLPEVVKQVQVCQTAQNRLEIRVIPRDNFTGEYEGKIRLALTELCDKERIFIDFKHVNFIPPAPSGKPQFFVPLSQSSTS